MRTHNCAACRLRARYDARPDSLIGRLWRWHINWCPGWRGYVGSLGPEERQQVSARYQLGEDREKR